MLSFTYSVISIRLNLPVFIIYAMTAYIIFNKKKNVIKKLKIKTVKIILFLFVSKKRGDPIRLPSNIWDDFSDS